MIYLDNAATTRVYDCAIDAATEIMKNEFFNPNTTYKSGVSAREKIEVSRKKIADIIGARTDELVFTSCATEANNWVFNCGIKRRKGNIVITAGEHASVYEPAMQLKNKGWDIRIAPLTSQGTVDQTALLNLVDDDTALVSIIHVSNETGAVNPVKQLVKEIRMRSPHAVIHSDGVQGLIKTGESVCELGVDYYSASAHKLGAPKGIGLLYVRSGLNISPFLYGGGQENGLRSGTQNTPYIAAFAAAAEYFKQTQNLDGIISLRNELCQYFVNQGFRIIGDKCNNGYIVCACIPNVKAEILQNIVHDRGVIIGKGAACSGTKRGNRVLSAIGLKEKEIECCIRISLFPATSREDVISAAQIIMDAAQTIRSKNVGR